MERPDKEIEQLRTFQDSVKHLPDDHIMEVDLPHGGTKRYTIKHLREFNKLTLKFIDALDSKNPKRVRKAQRRLDACVDNYKEPEATGDLNDTDDNQDD